MLPRGLIVPLLATCATAFGSLRGQTIWNVGPGGFPQIDPAIAAASPGDVILVAPGTYNAFTLDKALTIAALPGGPVSIMQGYATPIPTVRLRPPVGTTAYLRGIEIHNPPVPMPLRPPPFWAVETVIERGTVCCEDCLFEATAIQSRPGLLVTGARAVLRHCFAVGYEVAFSRAGFFWTPGLQCLNAQVEAVDCWFHGGFGEFDLTSAAPAVYAQGSTLHFVRCTIEGGSELSCFTTGPAPGILSQQQTRLWLADCTVRGGDSTCQPGAPGIQHAGPTPVEFDRGTITGGNGTAPGAPIAGPATATPLLGLAAPAQPLVLGQPWTVAWLAAPATPVFVLAATDTAAPVVPEVVEPVLLPPLATTMVALLITDNVGAATYATRLPNVPALRHAHLLVQGIAGAALPLRSAPPLGYVLR